MELGEKLKQARVEAGLSQRQLCGDVITRNMLSQIEHGTARPSMATLRYLAQRLEKPISYFLEENAVASVNQEVMARLRTLYTAQAWNEMGKALDEYQAPDPVFDLEYILLKRFYVLDAAEKALQAQKDRLALRLLEELGPIGDGYCREELESRRLLMLARILPRSRGEILRKLPPLDEELLLRAENAVDQGDLVNAEHWLACVEEQNSPHWNFLRGQVYQARGNFRAAVACFLNAEELSAARLEVCYRELGDFERAYYYACKQRNV